MPIPARRTKAEQRETTARKLVQVGREVFAQQGYARAATEEIVQRAGVTRGALYHHFSSKEGLFRAVLDDVQQDVARRIDEAASQADDRWEQLRIGCRTFLTASSDPEVRQIMLIDGPAVLGWETWRRMDAENSARLLHASLRELGEAGTLKPLPLDALAHLLSGAMNEAALWIAGSAQTQQALSDALAALEQLLEGVRLGSSRGAVEERN